jgi:hypothetical protein
MEARALELGDICIVWEFSRRNVTTVMIKSIAKYILSAVKTGLHSYCDTSYSRGGVNQMWILKNSKDLLGIQ